MAVNGSTLVPFPRAGSTTPVLERLLAGAVLRGRVLQSPTGASLFVHGATIPLNASAPFANGAAVQVRYSAQQGGLELQPIPHRPAPAPGATLSPVLHTILDALPKGAPASLGNALLPHGLPLTQADVAALVRLLHTREALGPNAARIVAILDAAASGAGLPASASTLLREFARLSRAESADDFVRLLRSAQRAAGRPVENLLASTAGTGSADEPSLVLELSRLRGDRALRAALAQLGLLSEFEGLVDSILERRQAVTLQHLHGRDSPYHFFELPLHADSGIRHAAVHVFPDSEHERGAHGARKRRSEIVVLDLSLTRLGDLWITIQRTGDACICRIQADSHVAIAALDERRQELAEALRDAGFDATVTTGPWTGDRLLEAARLMERSRGFAISG